ncbi:MAG: VCBS repeat-containing protein [Elusimicrobia bacterium]|nr:VCBS repeat-containing protein [Elusimicrobiota bacterium]
MAEWVGAVPFNPDIQQMRAFQVGDFNGDSYDDLLVCTGGITWVGLSNGGAFLFADGRNGRFSPNGTETGVFTGDFNGDGRSDIAFVSRNGISWVGVSSGTTPNLLTGDKDRFGR